MKKLAVLGVAGVLSLAMGTSVFAADSSSGYACAMIGHHVSRRIKVCRALRGNIPGRTCSGRSGLPECRSMCAGMRRRIRGCRWERYMR